MKLKHLTSALQQVTVFENPKAQLEQYPTSAEIASQLLYTANETFDDIDSKSVIDLGVGCGVLSCGALMLDAGYTLGIDIDTDAIRQASENAEELELELDLMQANVASLLDAPMKLKADTVIMNPPFGTKKKGIDMTFLQVATQISEHAIYSLHKTSTREYILNKVESWGFTGQVVAELRWDIPAMYHFHKKKSVDIEVDFIRFEKKE